MYNSSHNQKTTPCEHSSARECNYKCTHVVTCIIIGRITDRDKLHVHVLTRRHIIIHIHLLYTSSLGMKMILMSVVFPGSSTPEEGLTSKKFGGGFCFIFFRRWSGTWRGIFLGGLAVTAVHIQLEQRDIHVHCMINFTLVVSKDLVDCVTMNQMTLGLKYTVHVR